jgi:hypothetical protein
VGRNIAFVVALGGERMKEEPSSSLRRKKKSKFSLLYSFESDSKSGGTLFSKEQLHFVCSDRYTLPVLFFGVEAKLQVQNKQTTKLCLKQYTGL